MDLLAEIRKSGKKSKELNSFVARLVVEQKPSSKDFAVALASGNDSERGTCLEALEFASQKDPAIAKPYIPEVITGLADKAPRAKWEAARVIANIAAKCPIEAVKATNNLLANTNDKGVVVRWSAAFALGEILKSTKNTDLQKEIEALVKKETSSGVKNVYLKALKSVQ